MEDISFARFMTLWLIVTVPPSVALALVAWALLREPVASKKTRDE